MANLVLTEDKIKTLPHFPLPGPFKHRALLELSSLISVLIGGIFMWLTSGSRLHLSDVFGLFGWALIFWYTAYRVWKLPVTTVGERGRHLAYFFVILWVVFLGLPFILILLDLYPASIDLTGYITLALSASICALGVYFLTTSKWWPRWLDMIYVTFIVLLLPIIGIYFAYWTFLGVLD